MGIQLSLLVTVVILLAGWVAGVLPFLKFIFGVILPYVALAVFAIGLIVRVLRWARSPVPFQLLQLAGRRNPCLGLSRTNWTTQVQL